MKKIVFFAIAFCTLMLFTATGAQAATQNIKNPVNITIHGVPSKDGSCTYSGMETLAPSQPTMRQESVYQDTSSCTMVVAEGERKTPEPSPHGGRTAISVAKPASAPTSRAAVVDPWYYSAGWSKSTVQFPWYSAFPYWDNSNVTTKVSWWWNGGMVYGNQCGDYRWWNNYLGMYEYQHNLSCYYANNQLVSNTYAYYKQYPGVVATGDAYDRYNWNTVSGGANGWLYWSWSVDWYGDMNFAHDWGWGWPAQGA